jgi:hypothetical protein
MKWATAIAAAVLATAGCAAPPESAAPDDHVVLRVNCGAVDDYADSKGDTWLADRWFIPGELWGARGGSCVRREGIDVADAAAPGVYLAERYGMQGYEFVLLDGDYSLRLHFAETYDGITEAGARVFSVTVNGQDAVTGLDPFAEGGGLARPVVQPIGPVRPAEGRLVIGFREAVQTPEINGIELIAQGITEQEAEKMAEELARPQAGTDEDVGSAMVEELQWRPHWVTRLGCIEGGLGLLGRDVSRPWLAGTSGYAFALNIEKQLCPSAPFVWDNGEAFDALAPNVGYTIERVSDGPDLDADQARRAAWAMVRRALDEGTPCFSFDIGGGEYFVVFGYDKGGYYYRGFDNSAQGPIPWQALGTTGIVGVVHMAAVHAAEPADDRMGVRDAIDFALDMQARVEEDNYTWGLGAYDTWIAALHDPGVNPHGASFNAQYWAECRRLAVDFLKEADVRLADPGLSPLFAEAVADYGEASENLNAVAEMLPMDGQWGPRLKDQELVGGLVSHLQAARAAEEEGLAALGRIAQRMEDD